MLRKSRPSAFPMTLARRCAVSRASRTTAPNWPVGFGNLPNNAKLIGIENPAARLGLRAFALHSAHNRHRVVVMPSGVPIADRPNDGENDRSACRVPCLSSTLSSNAVISLRRMRSELAILPSRQNVAGRAVARCCRPCVSPWPGRGASANPPRPHRTWRLSLRVAGSPERTRLMASRACSRACSIPRGSAAPMVVQTCLPEGV